VAGLATVSNTSIRYELISCILGALLTQVLLRDGAGCDSECDGLDSVLLPSPAGRSTESWNDIPHLSRHPLTVSSPVTCTEPRNAAPSLTFLLLPCAVLPSRCLCEQLPISLLSWEGVLHCILVSHSSFLSVMMPTQYNIWYSKNPLTKMCRNDKVIQSLYYWNYRENLSEVTETDCGMWNMSCKCKNTHIYVQSNWSFHKRKHSGYM
jgi:hypothetical protein